MPATVDNQAFNWNAAGTENILVWGADVEIGSFPSSYIPTTTVAVTRAADVFRLGLTGMVNLAGFTYFLQADPSQGVSQELLWSGEPGANDTTEAFNSTGSVYQSFLYASGGTVHADVTAGSPSTIKLAQAFSNVDLSVRASVNGSAVASASSSGTLKAVTDMTVGAFRTNATNNYFGKFQQLGIFPSMAIPNADLQRLTQ
jgi:hypothetical protein